MANPTHRPLPQRWQRRTILLLGLLVLAGAVWAPLKLAYQHWQLRGMFVTEVPEALAVGPAIGSHFPGLQARGEHGAVNLLQPFEGPTGTVLVVLQSVVHSRYCAEQLQQLQDYYDQFAARGIAVVVLTQDSQEALRRFAVNRQISIPLLGDTRGLSATTLGVRRAGTPLTPTLPAAVSEPSAEVIPGVLIIDRETRIAGKVFPKRIEQRLHSATLLAQATSLLSP